MRVLASHLWIMAALLSVVMISCGREEPEEQKKPEDFDVNEWENTDIDGDATMSAVPIEFNIENTGEVMRGATPFNGEGYVFSPDDRITIELTRNGVATQKVYKVATVVTDPLEFDYDYDPTGLPFYWETKDDIQMRAWSYGNSTPYTKDPVGNPFTLNTDQREVTSGKDNYKELLYSPQQTYSYSSSVPIKLYHQLARLTINLTHEASGDLSVSQVTIGNSSLPTTATFNETGINIPSSYVGSWAGHSSATGQVIARADVANQKYSAVLFPNTYTAGNKIVNVKTSDNNTYAYELPSGGVTLNAGKQYNYTITLQDDAAKRNPLWYMAETNVKSYNSSTKVVTLESSATTAGSKTCYNWATAMVNFAATHTATQYDGYQVGDITDNSGSVFRYHLPTNKEMTSIFGFNPETNLFNATAVTANTVLDGSNSKCRFGYSAARNSDVTDVSYWGTYTASSNKRYAIRFIGTDYCSVWKYHLSGSILTISAKLIDKIQKTETSKLASMMSTITNANDAYWTENVPAGAIQRKIYAVGYYNNSGKGGNGTAESAEGTIAYYWGTTDTNGDGLGRSCPHYFWFGSGTERVGIRRTDPGSQWGYPIRLFRAK